MAAPGSWAGSLRPHPRPLSQGGRGARGETTGVAAPGNSTLVRISPSPSLGEGWPKARVRAPSGEPRGRALAGGQYAVAGVHGGLQGGLGGGVAVESLVHLVAHGGVPLREGFVSLPVVADDDVLVVERLDDHVQIERRRGKIFL